MGWIGEAFSEHDGELIGGLLPSVLWHGPFFTILRNARNSSLVAASSLGKWPRFFTILRSRICRLSMALVV